MSARAPITVIYTTKDEEVNLPSSLDSVKDWAEQVFVVDSGSTDRTRQIAEDGGATFIFQQWLGFAGQKNWAIDNLPVTGRWVFILDGDEVITRRLRDELCRVATEDNCRENGFYVNRYLIFMGKAIRHCGYYPSWNIRFFRRGKAHYEQRDVHEHMIVDGPVGYLKHDMEHNDRRGLEDYIAKHNRYSTLEAREMAKILLSSNSELSSGSLFGNAAQRRRWIKTYIWPWLPARWLVRFLYMYVFRLGFLDGLTGFHFCLLLAAYEHQISLKLREIRMQAKDSSK